MASEAPFSPIERVTIYPLSIPLKNPFKIATMTAHEAPNVFVSIQTRDGLVGWGEASFMQSINGESARTVVAALQDMAELLIGKDACQVRRLSSEMARFLPAQNAARCALDIALCDLASQTAGMPLWRWLGGESRALETDMTIGAVSPEEAEEQAAELSEKRFRVIKLKIGTGVARDVARFEAVRRGAKAGVRVRLDANQGYTRLEAHQAFAGTAFDGAEFCEQPLARQDLAGMAWVSSFSRVPVMADESVFTSQDVVAIHREQACPLINVKVSKSGGVMGSLQVAETAAAGGLSAMMGGMMETRLGVTASAHLASVHEVFRYFDLDAFKDHKIDPIVGGISIIDGCVHLPDSAGLGCHPDPEYLTSTTPLTVN